MNDSTDTPFDDQAPPIIPGELESLEMPARWPTAVGWLSIIFGTLSLTCMGTVQIGSIAFMDFFLELMAKNPAINGTPPSPKLSLFVIGLMFLSIAWQLPLIIAGVATVMRKTAARPLHLMYAIGYPLTYMISIYFGMQVQKAWINSPEMVNWIAANAGNPQALAMAKEQNLLTILLQSAFFLAWATFCLIWFLPAGRSERAFRHDGEDDLI